MSIRISEQHGVNPSVLICPVCGESSGVALCGRLPGDAEAPRQMQDQQPCDRCADLMTRGVFLIQVRDGETDGRNPYRTGPLVCITEEAFLRNFAGPEEMKQDVLLHRVAWVQESDWKAMGLPEVQEEAQT